MTVAALSPFRVGSEWEILVQVNAEKSPPCLKGYNTAFERN